ERLRSIDERRAKSARSLNPRCERHTQIRRLKPNALRRSERHRVSSRDALHHLDLEYRPLVPRLLECAYERVEPLWHTNARCKLDHTRLGLVFRPADCQALRYRSHSCTLTRLNVTRKYYRICDSSPVSSDVVPSAEERPVLSVEEAGRWLGLSRGSA